MTYYLSKSDFKIATTCARKLYYKKMDYPTSLEENDFMQMLAEGGYMIGKMAQVIYPGIEIRGTTSEAIEETGRLLQLDHVVLHEAAIQAGQKIIRVDILRKSGNVFELIEVKAKSFNSEDDPGKEKKDMDAYIEDVVFQALVLQEAYPDAEIHAYLLMPDKSRQTGIEGLGAWFKVKPNEISGYESGKFRKIEVGYIYENTEAAEEKRDMLLNDGLLQLKSMDQQVIRRSDVITNRTNVFLDYMNSGFTDDGTLYSINKNCKDCEFRATAADPRDGFKECWGSLSETDPHVFDLYHGGTVGGNSALINQLIKNGKVSLYDFNETDFVTSKGEVGSRNTRQLIQYRHTRDNREYISPGLRFLMKGWKYPLHFIDFETYTGAIPWHMGMHPYEVIAFQWSCHTINGPGEEPIHSEWINTEPGFPNFRFAQSLKKQIGESGTPFMWATHENTVLRNILNQMDEFGYHDDDLKNWLMNITRDDKAGRPGRFVDMNACTLDHYFHPYMKGKTSIKKTLPAIWYHHPELHEIPWFRPYLKKDENGNAIDPYQTLKHLFDDRSDEDILAGKELEEVVKEGSAAMKAYADLMFGDPSRKEKIKHQLLEYCKLDTLAMVIIWEYWRSQCG